MRIHSHRPERTLARAAEVSGVGFLTGAHVQLRFLPAPPSSGVVFIRTDLQPAVSIPAHVDQVTGTARRTTLGHLSGQVALVEHVLAALAGLRIDNCLVEIDAPETPGCDGSSQAFVEALNAAGVVELDRERETLVIDRPITVREGPPTVPLSWLPP